MDLFKAFDISASGMTVQGARMNVISSNMANVNSTRSADGGPYRKQSIVIAADPADQAFEAMLRGECRPGANNVRVLEIIEEPRFRMAYMPDHPDANADGYVAFPDIEVMEEMVDMMTAVRSYEANVQAIGALKGMFKKALEIGK